MLNLCAYNQKTLTAECMDGLEISQNLEEPDGSYSMMYFGDQSNAMMYERNLITQRQWVLVSLKVYFHWAPAHYRDFIFLYYQYKNTQYKLELFKLKFFS